MRRLLIGLACSLGLVAMLPAASSVGLTVLGTVSTGVFRDADPRNAEINAYDPFGHRVYVVNPQFGRLDVIDISNPATPTSDPLDSIDLVAACDAVLGEAACPVDQQQFELTRQPQRRQGDRAGSGRGRRSRWAQLCVCGARA